ncbi:FUSC family protein [Mycobacteroides abscessus]
MGASARTRVHARPDRQDHWHALRVAAGLALPGALLLAAGRPELLVYSVFGSFTGIYGRGESGWLRTRHQIQAGLLLCAGVALGVTLSWLHTSAWMLVVVEVAFATAGSVIADVLRLRPAGPFFFIFAMGATATVPAGPVTPMTALGLCAGTALLSVLIGSAGSRATESQTAEQPDRLPPDVGTHALRYALAVSAAGGAGLLLGFDHANWAMAAAAVPLSAIDSARPSDRDIARVLARAGHRTAGTFAGLILTGALLALGLAPIAIGALVITLLFPTELFMARHYALAVGFFTPLVMLMTELADPTDPFSLILFRGLDTVIGVAAGVVAAMLLGRRQILDQPDGTDTHVTPGQRDHGGGSGAGQVTSHQMQGTVRSVGDIHHQGEPLPPEPLGGR